MKALSVSVVICAYTEERLDDIRQAVDSVLAQTLQPHQVIVAVDHNEDLYHRLLTDCPSRVTVVLNSGHRGLSETRNVGVRSSTGDIVGFIDDDAVAEETWVEHLSACYENHSVVGAGGSIVPLWSEGERPRWFPEELDWIVGCTYNGLPLDGNECRNMIGCNMSFRRDTLQEAGLFNTEVGRVGKTQGAGEEAALCLSIRRSIPGSRILFAPQAVVFHKVPSWRVTLRYLARRSHSEGLSKAVVKRLSAGHSGQTLSTESTYLKYLLGSAIPRRLWRFYQPHSVAQAGAIIISIVSTVTGYLRGCARR